MSVILEHDISLGFWQNLLRGELGLTYLRQHIYVESWAEEKIDQGYLPVVVYSWGGAHGATLVGILEGAGYGPRALNVIAMLQLGLGPESDWGTIVTDRALMDAVFAMPTMRAMVFGSAVIMGQALGHANARAALFANSTAVNDMLDSPVAMVVVANNTTMINTLIGITTVRAAVIIHPVAFPILITHQTSWGIIFAHSDTMNDITISRESMRMIGSTPANNRIALASIAENETYRTRVEGSATAIEGLNSASGIILIERTSPIGAGVTIATHGITWVAYSVGLIPRVENLIGIPTTVSRSGSGTLIVNRFGNNARSISNAASHDPSYNIIRFIQC